MTSGLLSAVSRARAWVVLLGLAALPVGGAPAAQTSAAPRRFSLADGLPNPAVTAIARDDYGMLWAGTLGGLARLDGARFRRFDASGPSGRVRLVVNVGALAPDGRGRLWVGTEQGLCAVVLARETVRCHALRAGPPADVIAVWLDLPWVWAGTTYGLYRFDTRTSRALRVDGTGRALPHPYVTALHGAPGGGLWVGTSRGLAAVRADGTVRTTVDALDGAFVAALRVMPSGALWASTLAGGIYDVGREVQTVVPPPPVEQPIASIARLDDDRAIVARWGGGAAVVDGRSPGRATALAGDALPQRVYTVMPDGGGHVWLGTDDGLVLADTAPAQALRTGASVSAVHAAADGSVWAGLTSGGLVRCDPASGACAAAASAPARAPAW